MMFVVILVALAVQEVLNVPLESTVIAENGDIIITTTNEFKKTVGNEYFEQKILKRERVGLNAYNYDQQVITHYSSQYPVANEALTMREGGFNRDHHRHYNDNSPLKRMHSTADDKEGENRKKTSINLNGDYNKRAAKDKPELIGDISATDNTADRSNNGGGTDRERRSNVHNSGPNEQSNTRRSREEKNTTSKPKNTNSESASKNDGKIYFEPMLRKNKSTPATGTSSTTTPASTETDFLDNRNAFDVNVTCEPGMVAVQNKCVETPY